MRAGQRPTGATFSRTKAANGKATGQGAAPAQGFAGGAGWVKICRGSGYMVEPGSSDLAPDVEKGAREESRVRPNTHGRGGLC